VIRNEALIERATKERRDRDATAWAACTHLIEGNTEYATELAQKAQGCHDEWQDTLRSIGLEVFLDAHRNG
jgi:hypothetical protein